MLNREWIILNGVDSSASRTMIEITQY